MNFIVTKGVPDDARNLRMKVFVEEQGFVEEFDEIDDKAHHIVMYIDEKAVATGRIFVKEGRIYKIGRVAVEKKQRNKGYGIKIMNELEKVAKTEKAEKILISSQYHARKFYENCGYVEQGSPYLEENVKHILMQKIIN